MKLDFSREFVDAILTGRKRSTLRLGPKPLFPGLVVELTTGGRRFGRALVREVRFLLWSEVTDAIARMDGFPSRAELEEALARIYGRRPRNGDFFTLIIFELL